MFDLISQKFSSIFSSFGQKKLSQENVDETLGTVKDVLLEADVPYEVVEAFAGSIAQELHQELVGKKLTASLTANETIIKIVHDKLLQFLGGASEPAFSFQLPAVVMVMGLQGAGKTTTIAKLAHFVKEQAQAKGKSRKIMLASVDFYRPAAIDQLEIMAGKAGVLFYRSPLTDPLLAAQDIVKKYQQEQCDLLFLDTAGRLHVDEQMLEELKKIDAALKPKYKLLVIDAMTGQESLKVARSFDEKVGFMGAILTKMDSDTRGGAAFAFRYALKKPILYVAVGEKIDDLELYRPDRMAGRIMGKGDIATLIEKAEQKIKQSEQESLSKSIESGKLSLEDFAQQLQMMGKLGSLSSLMKYVPGMNKAALDPQAMEKAEHELKMFKAIISSMTRKERVYPKLLDGSRKKRIAAGAGVQVQDINSLLSRFEQTQQFVKLYKQMSKGRFF